MWSSSYVRIFKFSLIDGRVIHSVVASSAWVQVLDRQHWPWIRSQVTITSERWIYSSFHSSKQQLYRSKISIPWQTGDPTIKSLGLQNQAKNLLDMFLAFLFLLQLFEESVLGKRYLVETVDANGKKESRTKSRSNHSNRELTESCSKGQKTRRQILTSDSRAVIRNWP